MLREQNSNKVDSIEAGVTRSYEQIDQLCQDLIK